MASTFQDFSTFKNTGQNDMNMITREEMQNGAHGLAESFYPAVTKERPEISKKLKDELEMLGLKVQKHEGNIKFLKNRKNSLEETVLDMQVALGKYHSASLPVMDNRYHSDVHTEEKTIEHILSYEKSAAALVCQLKMQQVIKDSNVSFMKDVLGIVATLGKVEDDNLSRVLSEYCGMQTLLAVVCRTYDGLEALESYDKEGFINKSSGLHGLGASLEKPLQGRFLVFCLENLRPYPGEFVADDPQRKLNLPKPMIPNGESPPGFLGFAVNMIDIDSTNLHSVTTWGHGLRETLFYNLFSNLQVYRTREDMIQAIPYMRNGAVSLDGGIMGSTGVFSLGSRETLDVKFPKSFTRSRLPENYVETENRMKEIKWEKEKLWEDVKREQALLDRARSNFEEKKQELAKFLGESSAYTTQAKNKQPPAEATSKDVDKLTGSLDHKTGRMEQIIENLGNRMDRRTVQRAQLNEFLDEIPFSGPYDKFLLLTEISAKPSLLDYFFDMQPPERVTFAHFLLQSLRR